MRGLLMRLDAGYSAYFKLMHANVFTTSAALIIRYLARSCDASVRRFCASARTGTTKRGKKEMMLTFLLALNDYNIFSRSCVTETVLEEFPSKIIKNRSADTRSDCKYRGNNNPRLSRQSHHYGNLAGTPRYFIDVVRCWWCKFTLHASWNDVSSSSTHVNERELNGIANAVR